MREEIVVPLRSPDSGAVTSVRSTLIASSLLSLRARGHYERYLDLLAGKHRDTVLAVVAGAWLDVEIAFAHYDACEALALPEPEQRAIGAEVGDRAQKTFFGVLIRSATSAGVTPWTAFDYVHRARERMFQGGDVEVAKLGPKEARVTCVGLPFARVAYFRNAFLGVQAAGIRLFARRVYAREDAAMRTPTTFVSVLSWV